jgi:hypothetical protein
MPSNRFPSPSSHTIGELDKLGLHEDKAAITEPYRESVYDHPQPTAPRVTVHAAPV